MKLITLLKTFHFLYLVTELEFYSRVTASALEIMFFLTYFLLIHLLRIVFFTDSFLVHLYTLLDVVHNEFQPHWLGLRETDCK